MQFGQIGSMHRSVHSKKPTSIYALGNDGRYSIIPSMDSFTNRLMEYSIDVHLNVYQNQIYMWNMH